MRRSNPRRWLAAKASNGARSRALARSEAIALKGATRSGLTMNEAATIQRESQAGHHQAIECMAGHPHARENPVACARLLYSRRIGLRWTTSSHEFAAHEYEARHRRRSHLPDMQGGNTALAASASTSATRAELPDGREEANLEAECWKGMHPLVPAAGFYSLTGAPRSDRAGGTRPVAAICGTTGNTSARSALCPPRP